MSVFIQMNRIFYTGVILRAFSPEGSRAYRHDCRRQTGATRQILRKAQDDAVNGETFTDTTYER